MARPIVSIFVTLQDAPGNESIVRLHLPNNSEIANAKTFAQHIASAVDALTKGKVTNISLGLGVDLPGGLKAAADALADVEEGARFIFGAANGATTRVRIPTIDEAIFQSGTDLVNLTDTDVAAFTTLVIDGETINLQAEHPSTDAEEDITQLLSARSAFSKERSP